MSKDTKDYRDKTILVTGASGFIGCHLVPALSRAGCKIVAAVSSADSVTRIAKHDAIEPACINIADEQAVMDLVQRKRPDVIFHLAGIRGGPRTVESFRKHTEVTFRGTLNIAMAAVAAENCSVVHIGSSEEYGDGPVPFLESQLGIAMSPYSAAKLAAAEFLLASNRNLGLPVIILRPMVVYGPGQQNEMLIPQLFNAYCSNKPARLSGGEQSRDFVYIEDVVEAILMAGSRADLSGEIFNISSGVGRKVKDIAALVAKVCGYSGELGLGALPYKNPEVMNHVGSPQKALQKLGWEATTSLDEGLSKTYAWMKDNLVTA